MKEESQTTEKSIKPRVSKFTIPNDEKPTFGTCRVNSRSANHVSLDAFGFKNFNEKMFFVPASGNDLLYGIVKNHPSPNAYFYQSPNEIELYINKGSFEANKTIEYLRGLNWTQEKTIELAREFLIHLENKSIGKGVEINVIEEGKTIVFSTAQFYRIIYPLVKISTDFHYQKDIYHFTGATNIYDEIRNNCYCGNVVIDNDIKDKIRRNDTISTQKAFPVHKPTQKILMPPNYSQSNRFAEFERWQSSGSVDADGGLDLPPSSETPLTDSKGNKYDDFVVFRYIGTITKRRFAYHLKKYDYSDLENITDEIAQQARMMMKAKPVILQIAAIILNPNIGIRAAFREALDGGGDPNSIPCP